MLTLGSNLQVIPAPSEAVRLATSLTVGNDFVVSADPELSFEASVVTHLFGRIRAEADTATVSLTLDGDISLLGPEGYRLQIGEKGISIQAATAAGVLHGIQTLRQLLPSQLENDEIAEAIQLLCMTITDRPQFSWRGFMLDVSRHFFTTAEIKQILDWMSYLKLNVFHWHLMDDGGWRMEVKKYPNLTDHGAWRQEKDFLWDYHDIDFPGKESGQPLYGGFYTQDEMREVVAYAAERHITVVPELEMPGHSLAACWSYPELCCDEASVTQFLAGKRLHHPNEFCAGNEFVFEFLEGVIDELLDIFPSEFIHIGGDEVDKILWRSCSRCTKRMEEEGLASVEELQSYFIRRIERLLNAKGRRLMGWDEILEGGLAPHAAVMSWRGVDGGIQAARQGHTVVMTPTTHCYFDYDHEKLSTKQILSFNPRLPGELNPEEGAFVLGGQANLWTEYVPDFDALQRQTFPRLIAMAQVLWSKDTDETLFFAGIEGQKERLNRFGVHAFGE